MTDDDIVPETLQRVSLAAGRSWDPAAMHAAQKAQDFRFFALLDGSFVCLLTQDPTWLVLCW